MERKRFRVLFFIKRSKLLKNGEAPVRVRVTYDRLYVELQLKRSVKVRLSGNIWLVSFKISYLCLPLFYETRTTPSCHPSGCAYRQL